MVSDLGHFDGSTFLRHESDRVATVAQNLRANQDLAQSHRSSSRAILRTVRRCVPRREELRPGKLKLQSPPAVVTDRATALPLIASFHSLMSAKISLFLKINSLFRILGNSGRKHRWLVEFSSWELLKSPRNVRQRNNGCVDTYLITLLGKSVRMLFNTNHPLKRAGDDTPACASVLVTTFDFIEVADHGHRQPPLVNHRSSVNQLTG